MSEPTVFAADIEQHVYHFTCPTCGKPLTLWHNGGALDVTACCGKRYWQRVRHLDVMVADLAPAATMKGEG